MRGRKFTEKFKKMVGKGLGKERGKVGKNKKKWEND